MSLRFTLCALLLAAAPLHAAQPQYVPSPQLAARLAADRAKVDAIVDELIASDRAARGKGIPACADCAPPTKPAGLQLEMLADTGDAESTAWLQDAKKFSDAYLAAQGANFHPPMKSAALRCDGATDVMRQLAGLLNFSEQPEKFRQTMLRAYADGPDGYLGYVRDVKVWPVQARCVKGQLDGALDFWIFGREVRRYEDKILVDHKLVHFRTQMQAGKQVGAHTAIARTSTDVLDKVSGERKPLQRAADMDMLSYAQERPQAHGGDGKALALAFQVKSETAPRTEKATVSFTVPMDGADAFRTVYRGLQKSETMQMRHGLRHGLSQTWPFTEPLGPGLPDYTFPGSDDCYRNGEHINMRPCSVDEPPAQTSSGAGHDALQMLGRVVALVPFDKGVGFDRRDEHRA